MLIGGQCHALTQADVLIDAFSLAHVIVDKGYDSDAFLKIVAEQTAEAVIPARQRWIEPCDDDAPLYKERHLVEGFINKIKCYRCLFTRYNKLVRRYTAFLHWAATLTWLR